MKPLRQYKSLLVTGGAGFIGSAFLLKLFASGYKGRCVNLDLLTYAGDLSSLTPLEGNAQYRFQQGDIADQALVEGLVEEYAIDAIVHFAAESHVDRSIDSSLPFIHTNVNGTHALLEVVRKYPHIHFHHVSTDEVYGALSLKGLFTESSPLAPNSPYAASKAASDLLVQSYAHTYGLSTCISRCGNNFGPRQHAEKLIPKTIRSCCMEESIPVYGDGKNVRDWIYVEDHVEALLLLLAKGRKGEVYNIGASNELGNLTLIDAVLEHASIALGRSKSSLEGLIAFVEDRPGHDYRYALATKKMEREFGWKAPSSFQLALQKTVEWNVERFASHPNCL